MSPDYSLINHTLKHIDSNISVSSSLVCGQEPGAIHYACLKGCNQALCATSYHSSGPGIILLPNGVNLHDLSVNVTKAFSQAAHQTLPSKSENYANYSKGPHTKASNTSGNHCITTPPILQTKFQCLDTTQIPG